MPKESGDAFDTLVTQDRLVAQLLEAWRKETSQLEQEDDVETRFRRGSDVKLLLQHLAVREAAIEMVVPRLRQGYDDLAHRLEGDGAQRRQAIGHLDRLIRGHQGMATNTAETSLAVGDLERFLSQEMEGRQALLDQVAAALGPRRERGLPSARYVRTHSPTVPSPHARWYDRIGPLKALRALYDHLRGTPSRGTRPSVDEAREHTPGLRD